MMRSRTALFSLLGAVLAALALASPTSANALAAPGANPAHPYSDPGWLPFRDQTIGIDCAGTSTNNNDSAKCSKDHVGYYAINFTVPLYSKYPVKANPNPKVYAAGAGVVSQVVSGQSCNTGTSTLPGNEVFIQHGGGIVSVYQHLATVTVSVGEYVTQQTSIATAGATGAPCVNGKPGGSYLDFQVRHWGGSSTLTNPTPTLEGCADGKPAAFPGALPLSRYQFDAPKTVPTVWTQVPFGAQIYISSADFTCIPSTGGTGSPDPIPTAHLTTASASSHTLTWSPIAGVNAYTVVIEVKKGSSYVAPCSPFVTPGCTYGYYVQSASSTPHFTTSTSSAFRLLVWAHNGIGYSKASAWYYG